MPMFLRILLTPGCWIRNHFSSKGLSRFIQERLAAGEKPELSRDGYHIKLGGEVLWGGNYPYCYGSVCRGLFDAGPLPDRATVFMLHDAVEAAEFSSEHNKENQ